MKTHRFQIKTLLVLGVLTIAVSASADIKEPEAVVVCTRINQRGTGTIVISELPNQPDGLYVTLLSNCKEGAAASFPMMEKVTGWRALSELQSDTRGAMQMLKTDLDRQIKNTQLLIADGFDNLSKTVMTEELKNELKRQIVQEIRESIKQEILQELQLEKK